MKILAATVAAAAGSLLMQAATTIHSAGFGTTPDGRPVQVYTLANSHGVEAKITNYGGIVVSLAVPIEPAGRPMSSWDSIRWRATCSIPIRSSAR